MALNRLNKSNTDCNLMSLASKNYCQQKIDQQKVYEGSWIIENATCSDPPSLFNTCLKFIANNMELVESLVGFPDLIGEELFRTVERTQQLTLNNEKTMKMMLIFCEAYKGLVLESLNLKYCSFALHNCIVLVQNCFHSLKQLDLHSCRIGDEHEMLEFVANSVNLEYVGLCHNELTNRGALKLTAPLRIMEKGPRCLKTLDLSCNVSLTDSCIRYIKCFPEIMELDLSGTRVTENGVKALEACTNLILTSDRNMTSDILLNGPENKGWAENVVKNWLAEANQVHATPKTKLSAAQKFYSRKKQRLHMAHNTTTKQQRQLEMTPSRSPQLIFTSRNSENNNSNATSKHDESMNTISNKQLTDRNSSISNRTGFSKKSTSLSKTKKSKLLSAQNALDMITSDTNSWDENQDSDEEQESLLSTYLSK